MADPGVDPRHPGPPTPDAEADDADLEPLAGLLTDERPAPVPVTGVPALRPGTHGGGGQAVARPELVLQGGVADRLLPQRHRDLLQHRAVLATLSSPAPPGYVAV